MRGKNAAVPRLDEPTKNRSSRALLLTSASRPPRGTPSGSGEGKCPCSMWAARRAYSRLFCPQHPLRRLARWVRFVGVRRRRANAVGQPSAWTRRRRWTTSLVRVDIIGCNLLASFRYSGGDGTPCGGGFSGRARAVRCSLLFFFFTFFFNLTTSISASKLTEVNIKGDK